MLFRITGPLFEPTVCLPMFESASVGRYYRRIIIRGDWPFSGQGERLKEDEEDLGDLGMERAGWRRIGRVVDGKFKSGLSTLECIAKANVLAIKPKA